MTIVFRWLISLMVWLSADPHRIATEPGRAAAAVALARATLVDRARHEVVPVPMAKEPAAKAANASCLTGTCPPRR